MRVKDLAEIANGLLASPDSQNEMSFRAITKLAPARFYEQYLAGGEELLQARVDAIAAGQEVPEDYDLSDVHDWCAKARDLLSAKNAGAALVMPGAQTRVLLMGSGLLLLDAAGNASGIDAHAWSNGGLSGLTAEQTKQALLKPEFVQLQLGREVPFKIVLGDRKLMLSMDGQKLKLSGHVEPTVQQAQLLASLNQALDEAVEDALNAACLRIQQELGVEDGGFAGIFLVMINIRMLSVSRWLRA